MILYHGSFKAVEKPDVSFSRNNTDFGKGFYTTAIKMQAVKWTNRHKRRFGYGTLSIYEVDDTVLRKNASILEFETYSVQWLEFISKSRTGEMTDNYDLVFGGVANDDVFNTLALYFRGYINGEEAIKRLRYEKPNIQYCFKNQNVIDNYLKYTGMETL
ncbi:MAG: DUF3990 domain-containing protein [Treponema sp.]|nr:DUF3990 domain-containing protein [Treponema sp.]